MQDFDSSEYGIAIIGMAGRFPGAADLATFWRNLAAGVEAIRVFRVAELLAAGEDPAAIQQPHYVPAGGVLDDIAGFDAAFFGFTPREAEVLDPQQRLFLECAWEALEQAGYIVTDDAPPIGVFAGTGISTYLLMNLYQNRAVMQSLGEFQILVGNEKDFLPTRVSHLLGLKGPSINVQTACSTSLVAVHLACQSLMSYECDMALAGGVSIRVPHQVGYIHGQGSIFSPDGHCRAFAADAQGTVPGNGVGVVVLKRFADALADGDTIHAVIKGFAINNDGAIKVSYTAPSVAGQAAVIAEALSLAGVSPDSIGYVEAHGTGTALGDPIEIAALTQAFGSGTTRRGYCAVGSLKSNVGHLDAAAGVAGLIKTVLALTHQQLPPSLHAHTPNPQIDFAATPFYLNDQLRPWPEGPTPRRAGVSAFGIGGTNAHVVLEEAPEMPAPAPAAPWQVLVWSAATASALDELSGRLAAALTAAPETRFADVAYTLQVGRRALRYRRALVCQDVGEAVAALSGDAPERVLQGEAGRAVAGVAWLLPGLGEQQVGLGRELYHTAPVFRAAVDRCAALLQPLLHVDLRDVLYPSTAPEPPARNTERPAIDLRRLLGRAVEEPNQLLDDPALGHAALFVVEYALAELWQSWGVRPQALLGYSLGEYVAATLSGVFALADALALVVQRARLIASLPRGAMLAVPLAAETVQPQLHGDLAIAALNGPSLCVVAGSVAAVDGLAEELHGHGIATRRVATTHPLHSPLMEPIAEAVEALVAQVPRHAPQVPYLSNVTGSWITAAEATDPGYWARHLCAPVQLAACLATLLERGDLALVEVGAGLSLGSAALQQQDSDRRTVVVPSLPAGQGGGSERATLLGSAAQLWLAGLAIRWPGLHAGEQRRRVPLPTYPFEHRRFWIDPVGWDADAQSEDAPSETVLSQHERPNLPNEYIAPRTPLEGSLTAIWSHLLGIDPIGVHDNFFAMGGHSLIATQIVTAIRDRFHVELPLRALFEAPTVAELAALVEQSRQETAPEQALPLVPVARDAALPLSFAQERLWFLDRLVPNNPAYHIPAAVRLDGALDVAALEATLNQIIRRHEALRTTFTVVDQQPAQVIAPSLSIRLAIVELQDRSHADQEAELSRLITAEAQRPFDLSRGPLLRGSLFRLSPQAHVLLLTMHHIIADGWSGGVLVQEIAALYPAWLAGDPGAGERLLPDLSIQYADYALWQRQWLQGDVLEAQLDYWQRQLADIPVLALPSDRPRPAVQTFRGATQRFMLAKSLSDALAALSQREDVTLFMTLLAAFQTLLARYSGQDDIAVGTPIANRTRAELERLIGCFVNMVVMRSDLGGNPSFRDLLQRVRQVALGAYSHQDLPFERVVDAVQPTRDLSHTPLFQVVFILQNTPMPALELSGLRLREYPIESGTVQFDLVLNMIETADGLKGWLEYNTDLFAATTIERLIAHFQMLLAAVAAQPEATINDIPLLTAAERQMLADWNRTAERYPDDRAVHQLVAEQAARRPEAIAVATGAETLSYGELNRRANQLAHQLHAAGIHPEACVAVYLERSANLIVALLAILKAGAAYVPLDPATPTSRLRLILDDVQAPLVITQESLRAALPGSAPCLCLDRDWPVIARQPATDPADRVSVDQQAYVIYTSGSTGRPKGVAIEHRALLNLVFWHLRAFEVSSDDRATQLAGLSFDASVWEIWPYLAAGSTLCLPDAEISASPLRLRDWLRDQAITIAFAPTPLAEQMIVLEWASDLALRYMLTGGDQLHAYPAATLPFTLVNNYGPTENTVVTTSGQVPPLASADRPPDLGRPIANVEVYLLDRQLRQQPLGVPGEIYIGGSSLARGYHGRSDLTAEKFVPDPFNHPQGTRPGARLYRSGDLARYRSDGSLEFLGRNDAQVKLRGFRIELGEIEAVLNSHPQVRQSVVVVQEDPAGTKRLVAYFVKNKEPVALWAHTEQREEGRHGVPIGPGTRNQESQPTFSPSPAATDGHPLGDARDAGDPAALRSYLAERLPDYMLPSSFVLLDQLPLTANGKIDRRALPVPERAAAAARLAPPRTEAEHVLARIWSELLGMEQVGIHDNFFALGGDSILSMQVIARAAQEGWQLTPRQLFQHQTIAELAAVAVAARPAADQSPIVGDLPLTPIQHWFFQQDLHAPQHWNLALLLEVPPALDTTLLAEALRHLALHHDALRLRFFRQPDGWRQSTAGSEALLPCRSLDLAELSAEEQAATIEACASEAQRSLDLAAGPLARAVYFDHGPARSGRLLIVAHHLVIDGVSWRIVLEDLQIAYQQLSAGAAVQLPPKTTSYQQWAECLRDYAGSAELLAEWAYWREALPSDITRLPCDDPGGNNSESSAVLLTRRLAVAHTQALLHAVHRAYQTRIDDLLLTALLETLAPWIGDAALLVDLDRHGRVDLFEQVDLSRTVGWFTAIVPALLRQAPDAGIEQRLQAVKAQLQQIPRGGIGYGVLRYLSNSAEIVEHMRRLPQAELNFNYLGQIDPSLGGSLILKLAQEPIGPTRAPESTRRYLIEINAVIVDGALEVTWVYSANRYRAATIERLADAYMHALHTIIDHCLAASGM
jgi:amino acid adenylation domain-containing protein/non-ribosomal peptide synthase protein (TIGR01720 family)